MKAKIHAIAVIAAATMILTGGTRPQYLPAGGLPDSSGGSPFSLRQMP